MRSRVWSAGERFLLAPSYTLTLLDFSRAGWLEADSPRIASLVWPTSVLRLALRNLVRGTCSSDPERVRFGRMLETGSAKATLDQFACPIKHANAELLHSRLSPWSCAFPNERDLSKQYPIIRTDAGTLPTRIRPADRLEGDYAFEVHLIRFEGRSTPRFIGPSIR